MPFFTVHLTNHQYHIKTPQFSLLLFSSFLGTDKALNLEILFDFRDSFESNAIALKDSILSNKVNVVYSPDEATTVPYSTWFNFPKKDRGNSRRPRHNIFVSGVER